MTTNEAPPAENHLLISIRRALEIINEADTHIAHTCKVWINPKKLPLFPRAPGRCLACRLMDFDYLHKERLEKAGVVFPNLRQASQKLYDALQRHLDVADSELPTDLVEGMNELEAAWHKVDGTPAEKN